MSIETYDNIDDFGRAISESRLDKLKFLGKSDDVFFKFETITGAFQLPVGGAFEKPYLHGILNEEGKSRFKDKSILINRESLIHYSICKGMFAQADVEVSGYVVRFGLFKTNTSFMFNETRFLGKDFLGISGGILEAKGMFRGCIGLHELRFENVVFYDITRMVADSSIRELTFKHCDISYNEVEFNTNTKSCMYKNGKLETINFISCDDRFVNAMIEHINKYGEDDDNIVINIVD